MIYETDLFSFSFVPNWYLQLDALAELALPEPWRFRSGSFFLLVLLDQLCLQALYFGRFGIVSVQFCLLVFQIKL